MGDRYEALGNGDLTPEQLDGMDMWDRDVMLDERHRAAGAFLVRRAIAEIRRHRAAQTASEERVREVVRAILAEDRFVGMSTTESLRDAIATRAAKQLAGAVLSEPELRGLQLMRRHLDEAGHDWRGGTAMTDVQAARDLLDRLLARSTP